MLVGCGSDKNKNTSSDSTTTMSSTEITGASTSTTMGTSSSDDMFEDGTVTDGDGFIGNEDEESTTRGIMEDIEEMVDPSDSADSSGNQ